MEFTTDEKLQLRQWYNVYGWEDADVVEAAANDPSLRSILDLEKAIDPLDDDTSTIRRRITQLEPCHPRTKENVEDIVRMIGTMVPRRIPGCGEPDPTLSEQLRAVTTAIAAWADGDEKKAGPWAEVLGLRTPAKRWLVVCLCRTLAEQLRDYDGGEPLPQPRL
jgi:hypothetical protein